MKTRDKKQKTTLLGSKSNDDLIPIVESNIYFLSNAYSPQSSKW